MRDDLLTILQRWHRYTTELRAAVMVGRRRHRLSRVEALDLLDDLLEDIEETGTAATGYRWRPQQDTEKSP
jgi:hypothetical protein